MLPFQSSSCMLHLVMLLKVGSSFQDMFRDLNSDVGIRWPCGRGENVYAQIEGRPKLSLIKHGFVG